MEKGDNSFGVASVVLGIASIVLSVLVYAGVILGVLGFIFGILQRRRNKNNWALWGIILSVIGVALSIIILALYLSFVSSVQKLIQDCAANPNLPGCEEIAQYLQQTGGGA